MHHHTAEVAEATNHNGAVLRMIERSDGKRVRLGWSRPERTAGEIRAHGGCFPPEIEAGVKNINIQGLGVVNPCAPESVTPEVGLCGRDGGEQSVR